MEAREAGGQTHPQCMLTDERRQGAVRVGQRRHGQVLRKRSCCYRAYGQDHSPPNQQPRRRSCRVHCDRSSCPGYPLPLRQVERGQGDRVLFERTVIALALFPPPPVRAAGPEHKKSTFNLRVFARHGRVIERPPQGMQCLRPRANNDKPSSRKNGDARQHRDGEEGMVYFGPPSVYVAFAKDRRLCPHESCLGNRRIGTRPRKA